MSQHARNSRRKRIARLWLALIFLFLAAADVGLGYFAWDNVNPWPKLRGLVIAGALLGPVLIIALWNRNGWARYVLITLMTLVGGGFTLGLLVLLNNPVPGDGKPKQIVSAAIGIYFVCIFPLVKSRKIRHLGTAPGSGEH